MENIEFIPSDPQLLRLEMKTRAHQVLLTLILQFLKSQNPSLDMASWSQQVVANAETKVLQGCNPALSDLAAQEFADAFREVLSRV